MAEIEVHHHGHPDEPEGRRVGVLVGVVGILLSVVTISSHRAHTDAVIHRTESNDQWTYYQSKKTREQVSEVGITLLEGLGSDEQKVQAQVKKLSAARDHYKSDAEEIQNEARAKDAETKRSESKALRFDLGEGLLELGLVLCSLYFLAKKKFFPVFGIISALAGTIIGGLGFLL
jgi:sirohydrochlorin ferrochelatase